MSRLFFSSCRLWAVAAIFLLASAASAGTVTFTNQSADLSGTGFGNTLRILALHKNDSESGSVNWNGATDVTTGDATNQSQTLTSQELTDSGVTIDTFKLVLNVAEPGSSPTIRLFDFSLQFTNSAGVPLFADPVYAAPVGGLELTQVAAGIGGAGWIFDVALSPAEAALFFGANDNRLGMEVALLNAISMTGGAPEVFFVAPVPEPSSLALAAIGGLGLICLSARRRA